MIEGLYENQRIIKGQFKLDGLEAGAYTRPLFGST